jgi:hypothetical protein
MNLSTQIAKHFREVHVGGNWTSVNLKDNLQGLTWQRAVTQVHSFNSIATLVYHMNYYVSLVLKVFDGQPLDGHDTLSFNLPPITGEDDWKKLVDKTFADAEKLAAMIEKLPEDKWSEVFVQEKYGNYYRNIHGIIEHTHYHLGQITLIKKILLSLNPQP